MWFPLSTEEKACDRELFSSWVLGHVFGAAGTPFYHSSFTVGVSEMQPESPRVLIQLDITSI